MLTVLGSTGSIGVNTLDVVSRHPDKFQIFALTGAKQVDLMLAQCVQFKPLFAVMVDESAANLLRDKLRAENSPTQVLSGASALVDVACDERVTTVMAAIVGAAGLPSCLSAAKSGKRLLLANKEALVVGGQLFLDAVTSGGAQLLPIDSEHSAVFQALPQDPASWAQSWSHHSGPASHPQPKPFSQAGLLPAIPCSIVPHLGNCRKLARWSHKLANHRPEPQPDRASTLAPILKPPHLSS